MIYFHKIKYFMGEGWRERERERERGGYIINQSRKITLVVI